MIPVDRDGKTTEFRLGGIAFQGADYFLPAIFSAFSTSARSAAETCPTTRPSSSRLACFFSVWFMIGGSIDLYRLFHDLEKKQANLLDDGRVVGHVSAADLADVEKAEKMAGKK